MGDVWWTQDSPIGAITVLCGAKGVRAIAFSEDRANEFVGRAELQRVASVARELDDWFVGARRSFDCEVDLEAVTAPFARTVLDTLRREVGWGETVSYGELAEMAGRPRAARAVGTTMAHNPIPFIVPCHRVIAAGGRLGGYGGTADGATANLAIKRWLLTHEGVLLHAG